MWLAIIIIVLVFAIAIPIGVKKGKENRKLMEEGKMLQRGLHFADKGEEFTSKIGSFQNLSKALGEMELPCQMEGNTSHVKFSARTFSARLYRVKYDEPTGIAVYRFEFTSWKTYRSMYEQSTEMNILMTSVEKVFLQLDPNTAVTTYEINYKTKHSLF